MDTQPQETAPPYSELQARFNAVSEAFLELFALLEEYAPVWYTEKHHDRAEAAHRGLRVAKRDCDKF